MKYWFCIYAVILIPFQSIAQSVVINEVSYSNKSILYDNDGDSPDWFELFNPGDNYINLANYKVIDDTSKSHFWEFPEYRLEPKSYLIIFASGKNIKHRSQLHTDFKLGNMRESLFLIDPDGGIVDEIKPTCIPTDLTLARNPDGTNNLIVMKPSPGITNNNSEEIEVNYNYDNLQINYPGGLYESPLYVSMSNNCAGNVIMYTLDGDVPDEESSVYEQPIYLEDLTPNENRFANKPDDGRKPGNNIFKANILRAVVYSNGCPASNEITNTYFISKDIKSKYKVPIVSLITDEDNLFDDETGIYVSGDHNNFNQHGSKWEREVHVEIFDSTSVRIIDQDAGIRIHGRGSRKLPQKSFRLYADREFGAGDFQYPFFVQKPELARFKTLILRATNGTHGSLIKNELCNSLIQNMNIDYLAGETVVTFINGEYWGIYNLMERNDRHYVQNNYKVVNPDVDIISYDWDIIVEDGDINEYHRLIDFLQNADPESEDFYKEIRKKIDIDGLIDYFIAQMFLANANWPKQNLDLWKIKSDTSRWRYFFFDLDAAMIWVNYNQIADHNNALEDYQIYPEFTTLVFRFLIKNDDFKRDFQAKFINHVITTFNTDTVVNLINYFEKRYSPLVPEHIYRWHEPVDYSAWKKNIERLRNFAVLRPMIIAEQLQKSYGNPFTVYPNPGSGIINLTFFDKIRQASITIYSINGVLLYQCPVLKGQENSFQFKVNLPPGFYVLRIIADGISYANRLLIK